MVGLPAFYSNDPSLNPADGYSFSVPKMCVLERTNINEKIIGQRGLVLASVSLIFGLFKQH